MVDILRLLKLRPAPSAAGPVGPRQRELLQCLLENKDGQTVDQLVEALGVTRSAVHQHLASLERDGYVEKRRLSRTKGRPGQVYALTTAGVHQFPKQYDWFSGLLLNVLTSRLGAEELTGELEKIGRELGAPMKADLKGLTTRERTEAVAKVMTELGYVARARTSEDGAPEIQAFNCIYHHLAEERPEVCGLDLALLETLFDQRPDHMECMVRGGGSCRFRFRKDS